MVMVQGAVANIPNQSLMPAQQRRIGRTVDGRRHDPDLEHSVDHAIDTLFTLQ